MRLTEAQIVEVITFGSATQFKQKVFGVGGIVRKRAFDSVEGTAEQRTDL
jgi:hypothetical protein